MIRFAKVCGTALALVWLAAPAFAQELDSTRIPRIDGAKTIFSQPVSTIYLAPGTVADAAKDATSLLARDGWQNYGSFAQTSDDPKQQILTFKKDGMELTVFVVIAPAQNNTSVQYSGRKLVNDLPFPVR